MERIKVLILTFLMPILAGCVSTNKYADLKERADKCETKRMAAQEARATELSKIKTNRQTIENSLKAEIAAGKAHVLELNGRLSIRLVDTILFNSGDADLRPESRDVLDRLGAILKSIPDKDIRIEGHTDSVPIGPTLKQKYPTNWGLSTARATAVVRYLQEVVGLDPSRLSVVGYAKFHPIAYNNTPTGRAANRRIEIQIISPEFTE